MATLIQRSNGIFYFVISLKGKRIWKSTGARSKTAAMRFFEQQQRKIKETKTLTLGQFWTQYRPFAETNLAPSTVVLYAGAITSFIKYIGGQLLTVYSPQMIEQYKSRHLQKVSKT